MAFKLWYKRKDRNTAHLGPILGECINGIFIPFELEQAIEKLLFAEKWYKEADYLIVKVPFQESDRPELARIHPSLLTCIGIEPDQDFIAVYFTNNTIEIAKPDFVIENDWDIESELEDQNEEEKEEEPGRFAKLSKLWKQLS